MLFPLPAGSFARGQVRERYNMETAWPTFSPRRLFALVAVIPQ